MKSIYLYTSRQAFEPFESIHLAGVRRSVFCFCLLRLQTYGFLFEELPTWSATTQMESATSTKHFRAFFQPACPNQHHRENISAPGRNCKTPVASATLQKVPQPYKGYRNVSEICVTPEDFSTIGDVWEAVARTPSFENVLEFVAEN